MMPRTWKLEETERDDIRPCEVSPSEQLTIASLILQNKHTCTNTHVQTHTYNNARTFIEATDVPIGLALSCCIFNYVFGTQGTVDHSNKVHGKRTEIHIINTPTHTVTAI